MLEPEDSLGSELKVDMESHPGIETSHCQCWKSQKTLLWDS